MNMMDALTSFCWLSANLIWMGGEVFIRFILLLLLCSPFLDTETYSLMILTKRTMKLLAYFQDFSFCLDYKSK